jgi:cell division protein FtsA
MIKYFEKKTKNRINRIVLVLGGKLVKYQVLLSNEIKVNSIIDDKQMEFFDNKIQKWLNEKSALLIKSENIEYKVDNISVENPMGLYADTIQFHQFLAYANSNQLGSIVYLLEKNNLDVIDIIPSIVGNGALHLSYDERKLGALIFDIGATSVNWAYFFNDKHVNAGTINIGSEILTHKLAKSLKISFEQAQKLKYAHCSAQLLPAHFCSWAEYTKDNNQDFILESELIRTIMPEVNAIIAEIHKIILMFHSPHLAVICGSGAWLANLVQSLQKNLSTQIKLSPSANPEFDALNGSVISYQNDLKNKMNIMNRAKQWLKGYF